MNLVPFLLNWTEVERHRLAKWARTMLAAADQAVRARDAEIARLRDRIRTLERIHAVTDDRDAAFGDYATFDHEGHAVQGLWLLEADRPCRIATLAPGDRVFVLRRKSTLGRVAVPVEAPAAGQREGAA